MKFSVILAPEAVEDFRALKAAWRSEIRDALQRHLGSEPGKISRSRIKRLRSLRQPQYRLRVGDIRIFYDIEGSRVEVLAIVSKEEAEAWLAQFGKPE